MNILNMLRHNKMTTHAAAKHEIRTPRIKSNKCTVMFIRHASSQWVR